MYKKSIIQSYTEPTYAKASVGEEVTDLYRVKKSDLCGPLCILSVSLCKF